MLVKWPSSVSLCGGPLLPSNPPYTSTWRSKSQYSGSFSREEIRRQKSPFAFLYATDMSHTLGTTGSTTITTTAVQHQPPTASTSEEHTIKVTGGKAPNFASGGDRPATVVSLEQRKFYDHSLPVGLEGGAISAPTTVAPHIQPSIERSAPAPGHNTVGIGIANSGEIGSGRVAPILSTTSAFGEVQPTLAASTMLPAASYSADASIAPSRNWSGVTTVGPHTIPPPIDTIPSSLGQGVNFGQVSF